jgi:hypothetical protein
MKSTWTIQQERGCWIWASLLGSCAAVSSLSAADTNAPPAAPAPLTPEEMFEGGTNAYSNWINLGAGGFIPTGNKAQAQQIHQNSPGAFGGVEDFHYQRNFGETTTFSVDGRALFDLNDYKLSLDVTREKLGYLRFSYTEFRTWYNGDGGFYPPTDKFYPLSDDALALDRGEISFVGGLTLEAIPQITFKYNHNFRDGEKSSTIWGITHPAVGVTQGLSPSFYDIDEHSDSFQLDATHTIKATDFGVGLRYEFGKIDDALKITQSPGEPAQQRITDQQGTSYDLFNVHAFTETWLRTNVLFSSGFSYSGLDNNYSGSRVYGSDFDVNYAPAPQNGRGYYGLNGGSRLDEYVLNLNLMYKPTPTFSVAPSLRVLKEVVDADASGFETLGTAAPTPFSGNSDANRLDVRERLDLTYSGITNWVLHARGEWTEGDGNLTENGGLVPVNGIGVPPVQRETDDTRWFQKYSAGVRWYPTRRVVLDVGGYYKINRYDYDHHIDSTPNDSTSANRYPAYLVMQDFETYDGNIRLTLRPWQNVTLVSRYEYQYSTVHTKPDPVSGLSDEESATIPSQIIGQDISWIPWSRLSLQVGFNYVLSETKTPASDYTRAILDSQNNYWMVNFSSTLVLDDKSDLNIGYLYYQANDYENNSQYGVPYGTGAQEHVVTASVVRRISKNIRLTLTYGYSHYDNVTFGGNEDYNAQFVYSSLAYLF